jgi:hypothetical protein
VPPAAAFTARSSQVAIEPGSRTTGEALTIAVSCSAGGTVAPLSSPAEPSGMGFFAAGACP